MGAFRNRRAADAALPSGFKAEGVTDGARHELGIVDGRGLTWNDLVAPRSASGRGVTGTIALASGDGYCGPEVEQRKPYRAHPFFAALKGSDDRRRGHGCDVSD